MKKYKTLYLNPVYPITDTLNREAELGGWELSNVIPPIKDGDNAVFILERDSDDYSELDMCPSCDCILKYMGKCPNGCTNVSNPDD